MTRPGAGEEPGFVCLWGYRVRSDARLPFERVYGPNGDWAQLFRRSPGYLETGLYRDLDDGTRYISVDAWRTMADFDAFRRDHGAEYERLDQRHASLKLEEERLGCFERVSD